MKYEEDLKRTMSLLFMKGQIETQEWYLCSLVVDPRQSTEK